MEKTYTVVVYSDNPNHFPTPLRDGFDAERFQLFAEACARHNMVVYMAQEPSNYLGHMQFAQGWKVEGKELIPVHEPFTADIIYTKGTHFDLPYTPGDLIVSPPELEKIDDDKLLMYQQLAPYMGLTLEITAENWDSTLAQIPGEKIVLKPRTGSGGRGVFIINKSEARPENYPLTGDYLAQEFVDSSKGIPGIVDSTHDLRVTFFNDRPAASFVRKAKSGTLISNISQGGSAWNVPIEQLPQDLVSFAKKADSTFKHLTPRLYAVDIMFNGTRYYVSEINTSPCLPHPDSTMEGPAYTEQFFNHLPIFLRTTIEQNR